MFVAGCASQICTNEVVMFEQAVFMLAVVRATQLLLFLPVFYSAGNKRDSYTEIFAF
jgi:hypothetical protein